MQKKLIALAIAGCVVAPAFAQSNVQVYGIIDESFQSANFGNGSTSRIQGSGQFTERIGFQGSEDLGSGLKANFRLEIGMNSDTGNLDNGANVAAATNTGASQLFQREARVGLEGGFGTINIGRQYTPIFNVQAPADIFNVAGIGSNYTLTNTGMTRASNSVKWDSTNMSGFTAALLYGFGDAGTGQTSANGGASGESLGTATNKDAGRQVGLNAKYANGPLLLMYGYGKVNNAAAVGTTTVATKANVFGGAYDFKVVKIVAGYETAKNDPGTLDVKGWLLSAVIPVGADSFKASYTSLKDNTAANAAGKSGLFAVGYVHPLSKRTSLYGTYANMSNDAKATRSFLGQTGGGAQPISATPAAGFDPSGIQFGVSHFF
ncbi:MAG: porin [Proteobacteria bacterium]|nr:porin [Pseudomonadota bacterium]